MRSDTGRGNDHPINPGPGGVIPPPGEQKGRYIRPATTPDLLGGLPQRPGQPIAPEHQPIVRQHEEISDVDHFLQQWRDDKSKEQEKAKRDAALKRWVTPLKLATIAFSLGAVGVHAAGVIPSYQRASVVSRIGTASLLPVPPGAALPDISMTGKPIREGQTILQSDLPLYVATGAGSGVTLGLAGGEAIHIGANSLVEIREFGYDRGPTRRFVLWHGRIGARTQSGEEKFVVETGGMRCDAPGNTRLSLTSGTHNGVPFARLATPLGKARAVYPGGENEVRAGEQVTFLPKEQKSLKEPMPLSDAALAAEERMIAAAPEPDAVSRFLGGLEESVIVPVVQPILGILAIPESMNDAQKVTIAVGQMQALCTLMATGDAENGAPFALDLETLAPLSLSVNDRKKLMNVFANDRLYSYRTLPNGGYEILARAEDTKHTWIRGKNGAATTAGTGSEAQK